MAKKFKSQPLASKIMLTLFYNTEGVILINFTPKCNTSNSQSYCDVLWM